MKERIKIEEEVKMKERIKNVKGFTPHLCKGAGFTLIELAIVLVIIGILLAAVLKGQDLIQGARVKKFINEAGRKWETAAWTYLDRKGRFPGDADKNGIIGDGNVKTDFEGAAFVSPPTTPVYLGSYTFNVFLGNDGDTTRPKNILVICKDSSCGTAFNSDELVYIEGFDTAIDGLSDGTAGQVIGVDAAPASASSATWVAYYSTAPTAAAWSTSTKALLYYFDRKR